MADIRVLRKHRVQTVGAPVGMQISSFGLEKLSGISGADMEPIAHAAMQPALSQLATTWPIYTGASVETARIETDEINLTSVRVSLRIGGAPLIADARNKKHIDYAPYIEFNGSPKGTPPGTLLYAMTANDRLIRELLHEGVRALLAARLRA